MDSYEAAALIEALRSISSRLESLEYTFETLISSVDDLTERLTPTTTPETAPSGNEQ